MGSHRYKRLGDWIIHDVYLRNGTWRGRVRHAVTGRVRYFNTRETKRRRAEEMVLQWARDLKDAAENPEDHTKSLRFDRAFEEFLSLKHVRARTLDDYKRTSEKVFGPSFATMLVEEVELRDVEVFLKRCDKRGCSARTKQKYLTELRSFFRWARRREYCVKDPTDGVKIGRIPKKKGVALTHDQARALLKASREPNVTTVEYSNRKSATQEFQTPEHVFLAILIALHTGLRRGNVVGLRWSHIDLSNRRISIPGSEMKAHADFETPIHPELAQVLRGRLRGRRKINPKAPVLGIELGEIKHSFKSALKRADLPDIRWHDLRHTFSTWLATRAPFAVHQRLMGHSPTSVTLDYTHVPFEELRHVIDALPSLLSGDEVTSKRKGKKAASG